MSESGKEIITRLMSPTVEIMIVGIKQIMLNLGNKQAINIAVNNLSQL